MYPDQINALTQKVMRGEISCGAYADALAALKSVTTQAQLVPTFHASEEGLKSEDGDERGEPCKDCGEHDNGDWRIVTACQDCYQATCSECFIYFERAELNVCPVCANSGAYDDEIEMGGSGHGGGVLADIDD